MTDVDKTLINLVDRQAINDVVVRYCTAVDRREWDLMSDVFVPNGVVEFGSDATTHGVDDIVKYIRAVEDSIDASQHLVGNFAVEIDGDEATATTYFQAQHYNVNSTGSNTYLIGGTYRDQLCRTPDGWRIVHKYIEPIWYDGNAGLFGGSH